MKLKLPRRLIVFKEASPAKFRLVAIVVSLSIGWLGFLVYARNATVVKSLDYPPCQIDYGHILADWHGSQETQWDDERFYYVTKKYSVKSNLPVGIWANVLESPPTRLSTGSTASAQACMPDFDNLVDTTSKDYLWEGARPVALRIGAPGIDGTKFELDKINPRIYTDFEAPVYSQSLSKAAAWVDDGGQASVKPSGAKSTHLLWCQSNSQPQDPKSNCQDITNRQPVQASAGYLFTKDNCPEADNINCAQADGWYKKPGSAGTEDITKIIGTNERGEVKPFNLYLDAVSTYGYGVGTGMAITFKYSKVTELSNNLILSKKTVNAGDTIKATLKLGKLGPNLSSLSVETDTADNPLSITSDFKADDGVFNKLNNNEDASLAASFKVAKGAQPGQCYNLVVRTKAESVVQADGKKQVSIPELSAKYCIAQPQASVVHTYNVATRGNVQSSLSEFKTQAAQTLASRLGWVKAGVGFKAAAGAGDFTLVLASPDQMTSFSSGCDATYSCQVGRYVIINDERWRKATHSWNQAGGSLRDYRHMVVNHEVGHWLGFGHLNCPAAGAPAPVMQQQSISLQGCKFNPWPTPAEITSLKSRS